MRIFIGVILLLACSFTYAQSVQKIEQELLTAFKKISSENKDSLRSANEHFSDLLSGYTAKYPNTLRTEFRSLVEEGLYIASSEDGLFRIYSWDTREGGSMHQYETIYQYKIGNKSFSDKEPKRENDPGVYFSKMYMLKHEEKVWYLGLFRARVSSGLSAEGIKLFAVDAKGLNKNVKLFRTGSGLQNEIAFEFNMYKVADMAGRSSRLLYFDESDKKLHIPIVHEDGKVTNRFIVYAFNGEYFEKLRD
jgi:hypothetical protein